MMALDRQELERVFNRFSNGAGRFSEWQVSGKLNVLEDVQPFKQSAFGTKRTLTKKVRSVEIFFFLTQKLMF